MQTALARSLQGTSPRLQPCFCSTAIWSAPTASIRLCAPSAVLHTSVAPRAQVGHPGFCPATIRAAICSLNPARLVLSGDPTPQQPASCSWVNLSQPPVSLPATETCLIPPPAPPLDLLCPVPAGVLVLHSAIMDRKSRHYEFGRRSICVFGEWGWFGSRK